MNGEYRVVMWDLGMEKRPLPWARGALNPGMENVAIERLISLPR